jgi:UDP-glucose 4-epimerase
MRLLVTGALGHVGSRLIRSLPADTFDEVVLLDNLSSQRYCSLFDLPDRPRFTFVQDDILEADLDRRCAGVDAVVHLAAITDAEGTVEQPVLTEAVNLGGTLRVARACARSGTKLIFLSTTSVYGQQEGVVDEECPAEELRPQSPYAASKLRAESALAELGRTDGLEFVVCRFGTVFGPSIGMRFHTAVNKFVWQACNRQALTVWRTALHQRRPYLDLGDACRALLFILERGLFGGQVYNVLTRNATVEEIIAVIRQRIPDTHVEYVDSPIMNQLSYTVSCARFEALGFDFRGSLREGIGSTIDVLRGLTPSVLGARGA